MVNYDRQAQQEGKAMAGALVIRRFASTQLRWGSQGTRLVTNIDELQLV